MNKIYRVLYCSSNCLEGAPEDQLVEVRKILASSRKNNGALGITGALLFNQGMFAQVLEGPLQHVERTFERIQTDMRHTEVAVLEGGFVESRDFPEWSMAFAGAAQTHFAEFERAGLPEEKTKLALEIGALLRSLITQEDAYL